MGILPRRYRLKNVARLADNPGMLLGELNRLGVELNTRYYRHRQPSEYVRVMDEDWDNLLILDGCRYDTFRQRATLDGHLESRQSAGSDSWEFIRENFLGEQLHDTVYLTANPHAYRIDDGVFHRVYNLLDDHWDPDLQTVRPEVVAEKARECHERHPDKRLVVHFMQPHFPFIGETGREIDQGGIVFNVDEAEEDDSAALPVWAQLNYNMADEYTVRTAYEENLDIVLSVVEELLADLPGRTVVTSDHGNLIGDRLRPIPARGYGHPRGLYVQPLLEVPWHVIPGETRRPITADPPVETDRPDSEVVQNRLRSLGYRE